ncbi:MAG: DUF3144 domain-containing protein [Gammaproteobacteria bacterium]|nr:DUF3144 domain-containing protein [Gammaproteobacteria bacterium]MCP5137680.1 DUF3144 domain-containing protein [Gammaproteobacteria bacterium]
MNDVEVDQAFWERADAVIAVANTQCKDTSVGQVGLSTLYAAARFSAFNVAHASSGVADMKSAVDEAVAYFTKQFREMFVENLDDYIENFDDYSGHQSR